MLLKTFFYRIGGVNLVRYIHQCLNHFGTSHFFILSIGKYGFISRIGLPGSASIKGVWIIPFSISIFPTLIVLIIIGLGLAGARVPNIPILSGAFLNSFSAISVSLLRGPSVKCVILPNIKTTG